MTFVPLTPPHDPNPSPEQVLAEAQEAKAQASAILEVVSGVESIPALVAEAEGHATDAQAAADDAATSAGTVTTIANAINAKVTADADATTLIAGSHTFKILTTGGMQYDGVAWSTNPTDLSNAVSDAGDFAADAAASATEAQGYKDTVEAYISGDIATAVSNATTAATNAAIAQEAAEAAQDSATAIAAQSPGMDTNLTVASDWSGNDLTLNDGHLFKRLGVSGLTGTKNIKLTPNVWGHASKSGWYRFENRTAINLVLTPVSAVNPNPQVRETVTLMRATTTNEIAAHNQDFNVPLSALSNGRLVVLIGMSYGAESTNHNTTASFVTSGGLSGSLTRVLQTAWKTNEYSMGVVGFVYDPGSSYAGSAGMPGGVEVLRIAVDKDFRGLSGALLAVSDTTGLDSVIESATGNTTVTAPGPVSLATTGTNALAIVGAWKRTTDQGPSSISPNTAVAYSGNSESAVSSLTLPNNDAGRRSHTFTIISHVRPSIGSQSYTASFNIGDSTPASREGCMAGISLAKVTGGGGVSTTLNGGSSTINLPAGKTGTISVDPNGLDHWVEISA